MANNMKFLVYMPYCHDKKWKPLVLPDNIANSEVVIIKVPIELEDDEEGTSWSKICGGFA